MTNQWRVGHQGRDMMYYEESHDGAWQRISIDGEMLTGRAHHVIYFADTETWQRYPEWARHRRDEIIARIKSQFREPDYEYAGGGTAGIARAPEPAATSARTGPVVSPAKDGTILPMLALLLTIAAASLWFTWHGLQSGETRLPIKHSHARRVLTQADDPALYWTSITLTSALGTGCLFFSIWLIRNRQPRG